MNVSTLADLPSPIEVSESQTRPFYDHSLASLYTKTTHLDASNDTEIDFISILEICEYYGIDFLPITWQQALDVLGIGGQAEIYQSLVNLSMSFAFSRAKLPAQLDEITQEAEVAVYRALRLHIVMLAISIIRDHPNIITLLGVCWDIRPDKKRWNPENTGGEREKMDITSSPDISETQWRVWPVLVTERTKHGDLVRFMKSQYGRDLNLATKLKLCTDIARGIKDMHGLRKGSLPLRPFRYSTLTVC